MKIVKCQSNGRTGELWLHMKLAADQFSDMLQFVLRCFLSEESAPVLSSLLQAFYLNPKYFYYKV